MNNFFLLNEAVNLNDYKQFKEGIAELIAIEKEDNDTFLKHNSIWEIPVITNNLFSIRGQEENAIILFIEQIKTINGYLNNQCDFDSTYADCCNAFLGIDFTKTAINNNERITNYYQFKKYKYNHIGTIDQFWKEKNHKHLYPNLVFCANVFEQISHLSPKDERFFLIKEKLLVLDNATKNWEQGYFDIKSLGLDCSPDTPDRIKKTLSKRTFHCPEIGDRVFSLHIKWYFGKEPFRLYFYPHNNETKNIIYVGYIGNKVDIGF